MKRFAHKFKCYNVIACFSNSQSGQKMSKKQNEKYAKIFVALLIRICQ
jgi:hypothetical protein